MAVSPDVAFSIFNPFSWLRKLSDNNIGIICGTGAPTNGTSGTANGIAGPGTIYINITTGLQYVNVNTKASPTWSLGGLSGAVTGDVTISAAGVSAIGAGKVTPTMLAPNTNDKVLLAQADYASTVTPATIIGMSWTVVPGTYIFDAELFTIMTTVGGLTVNFKLTTAVLTSIQYATYAATASDNTTGVSTQGQTTTDATKVFDSKAAAYTRVRIFGSMVVGTGGTFAFQACQNTSAGAGDTTSLRLGSYSRFERAL